MPLTSSALGKVVRTFPCSKRLWQRLRRSALRCSVSRLSCRPRIMWLLMVVPYSGVFTHAAGLGSFVTGFGIGLVIIRHRRRLHSTGLSGIQIHAEAQAHVRKPALHF